MKKRDEFFTVITLQHEFDGEKHRIDAAFLEREIQHLTADLAEGFLLLSPSDPIKNSLYLQTALREDHYLIEICLLDSEDEMALYGLTLPPNEESLQTIIGIFVAYLNGNIPNIDQWIDISDQLDE